MSERLSPKTGPTSSCRRVPSSQVRRPRPTSPPTIRSTSTRAFSRLRVSGASVSARRPGRPRAAARGAGAADPLDDARDGIGRLAPRLEDSGECVRRGGDGGRPDARARERIFAVMSSPVSAARLPRPRRRRRLRQVADRHEPAFGGFVELTVPVADDAADGVAHHPENITRLRNLVKGRMTHCVTGRGRLTFPRWNDLGPCRLSPPSLPRGTVLSCRSWLTEAPYRMLLNNLDPEVAEKPRGAGRLRRQRARRRGTRRASSASRAS